MGHERNHQYGLKQKKENPVKILSKQISCQLGAKLRLYSTLATCLTLNPYFVTGFTDASSIKKSIRQFSTKSSNTNNTNLSLVVLGTNLTSTVGTGRFTKQVSNMIKLAPFQKSVLIGLLLSDG
jgi:hypothetical protein